MKGTWDSCINLTQSLAHAERIGNEWYKYRHNIADLGKYIYLNLTECKIKTTFDEFSCLIKSLQINIPTFNDVLNRADYLLNETNSVTYDIFNEMKHCLFRTINLTETIKSNCSFQLYLTDLIKLYYRLS